MNKVKLEEVKMKRAFLKSGQIINKAKIKGIKVESRFKKVYFS